MKEQEVADALVREAHERQAWGQALMAEVAAAKGMTFTHFLRQRAQPWSGRPALIHGQRTWTYEQMWEGIDRARHTLAMRGIAPGKSVALWLNNSDWYVIWYLAILGLGAVAVPLNNRFVAREAAYVLEHSEAALLLTENEFVPLIEQVKRDHGLALPLLMVNAVDAMSSMASSPWPEEPVVDHLSPAALYYTSGTTGQPKGVIHTHPGFIADALQSAVAWQSTFEGAKALAITPLFHIAFHTIFLPVLFFGGTLVVSTYETHKTLLSIEREDISVFFGVPSILLLMVDKAKAMGLTLPKVKTVMFGAAPMTISKLGEVQALFPNAALIHGMGQTESGGTLVTLPGFASAARAGSVGIALPAVEVAIFDEQDQPVATGTVGELVARGPNVMLGYFRNPEATAQTLRKGWLHTGDLGYQDAEGLVYLVDRKKDMIIRGGENIYSSEVEQVLLRHPSVKSAAVVGQRDALFGEQVAAFIVVDPQAQAIDAHDLTAHCRHDLADYKVPVTFVFKTEMPLTATGKIKKNELRDALPVYARGGGSE